MPPIVALVDDDLSVRRALPRLLKSAGYEARAFASAEELIDSGIAHAAACLVIDIHLGRTSGLELFERLIAVGQVPPTIFITAWFDEASRDRANALGACAYLRKPFDATALLDAVSRALAPAACS